MDIISRRDLLKRAGVMGAAAAAGATTTPILAELDAQSSQPAREPLETLTQPEADTLEAIVARLVPTDADGPGAREARAAHYIDRALGGFLAPALAVYREGLAALDAYARRSKGDGFARLAVADQEAVLADCERGSAAGFPDAAAFFTLVLSHTLQGTFGDPHYGGNRDFVGWDMVRYPGVRLAVTPDEQRLDRKPRPLRMSAYDYTMFANRKPSRADAGSPRGGSHGD